MADRYAGVGDDLDGPSSMHAAIVPSDTVMLLFASKAIYVGGAGDVTLLGVNDGAAVVFKAVPVGTVLRVRAAQVMATGTTATNLIAMI